MAGGYRVILAGALAALLFVTFGLGWISGTLTQTPNHSAAGQASARQSDQLTREDSTVTTPLGGRRHQSEEAGADQADSYAKERNERERRDIVAQEDAAKWSRHSFLAMIAQTLVAGAALIALMLDLRQNRINAERQLRAYVDVFKYESGPLNSDEPYWVKVHVANRGQTPAYKVQITAHASVRGLTVNSESFPIGFDGGEQSNSTLGIGSEFHAPVVFDFPMSPRNVAAIQAGVKRLYCFGQVLYNDIYGRTHRTRFRAVWQQDGFFMECQDGNEAD
jgi:hypothetical protein